MTTLLETSPYARLMRALGSQLFWPFGSGYNLADTSAASNLVSVNPHSFAPSQWCPPGYELYNTGGVDPVLAEDGPDGGSDAALRGVVFDRDGSDETILTFPNHLNKRWKVSPLFNKCEMTLLFWIKVAPGAVQGSHLFNSAQKVIGGVPKHGWEVTLRGTGASDRSIRVRRHGSDDTLVDVFSNTSEQFAEDEWVLIAIQYTGKNVQIIKRHSNSTVSWFSNNASTVHDSLVPLAYEEPTNTASEIQAMAFGSRIQVPDAGFEGQIAAPALFGYALSEADIEAIYQTGLDTSHDWSAQVVSRINDTDSSFSESEDLCYRSMYDSRIQKPWHGPNNEEVDNHREMLSRAWKSGGKVHGFIVGDSTSTINGNGTGLGDAMNYWLSQLTGLPPIQRFEKGGDGWNIWGGNASNDAGNFEGSDFVGEGDWLGNEYFGTETLGYTAAGSLDYNTTTPFGFNTVNTMFPTAGGFSDSFLPQLPYTMPNGPALTRAHFVCRNDTRAGQGHYILGLFDDRGLNLTDFFDVLISKEGDLPEFALDSSDPTVDGLRVYHRSADFALPASVGAWIGLASKVDGEIFPAAHFYSERLGVGGVGVVAQFANSGRTAEAEADAFAARSDAGNQLGRYYILTDANGTEHGPEWCIVNLGVNDIYSAGNSLSEYESDLRTVIAGIKDNYPEIKRIYLCVHPWRGSDNSLEIDRKTLAFEGVAGVQWKIANDTKGVSFLPLQWMAQFTELNFETNARFPLSRSDQGDTKQPFFFANRTAIASGVNQKARVATIRSSGIATFTVDGQTTASIAFNANAATVEAAFEALSSVASATVTGSNLNTGLYIEFTDGVQHELSAPSPFNDTLEEVIPAEINTLDDPENDSFPSVWVNGVEYRAGEIVARPGTDKDNDDRELYIHTGGDFRNTKPWEGLGWIPYRKGTKATQDEVHFGNRGRWVQGALMATMLLSATAMGIPQEAVTGGYFSNAVGGPVATPYQQYVINKRGASRRDPVESLQKSFEWSVGSTISASQIVRNSPLTIDFGITPVRGGSMRLDIGDNSESLSNPLDHKYFQITVIGNTINVKGPVNIPETLGDDEVNVSTEIPYDQSSKVTIGIHPNTGKVVVYVNGRKAATEVTDEGSLNTGIFAGSSNGAFVNLGHQIYRNVVSVYKGQLPRGF